MHIVVYAVAWYPFIPSLVLHQNSQTDQAGFGVSYVALKETLSVFRSNVSASHFLHIDCIASVIRIIDCTVLSH